MRLFLHPAVKFERTARVYNCSSYFSATLTTSWPPQGSGLKVLTGLFVLSRQRISLLSAKFTSKWNGVESVSVSQAIYSLRNDYVPAVTGCRCCFWICSLPFPSKQASSSSIPENDGGNLALEYERERDEYKAFRCRKNLFTFLATFFCAFFRLVDFSRHI